VEDNKLTEFCGTIDADAKRMARALNFRWANHQSRVEWDIDVNIL